MKLASLLIIAAVILLYKSDKPFWGHHDWNNAYFGNIARNYVRFGLIETKLGQVTGSGPKLANKPSYHTHHPPLLPLSLAASYSLFGISEISTRLVPIIFSIATLIVFYLFLKAVAGTKTALISIIFWIITPLYFYYGKLAVHEIPVLFFFVLSLWSYQKKNYLLLALSIFLGGLSGWPGHYIALVINLYHILLYRKISLPLLALFSLPIITFSLQLLHNYILTGSPGGGGLFDNFYFRSTLINPILFLKQELTYLSIYITKPILIISVFGFIFAKSRIKKILLVLFIFGILHPVLFQEASFRHDYLIYETLPFFTAASGVFINALAKKGLAIIVGILIISLSFLQFHRFLDTLLEGDRYKEAVLIGKQINSSTKADEKVKLIIPKDMEFEGWHTTFYADRMIDVVRRHD